MEKQFVLDNAPFFKGFYDNSVFSSTNAFESAIEYEKENDETFDESKVDFDTQRYMETCAKLYCMALVDEGILPAFVESVEFLRVVSPKYYNYSTDRIECKVTFADDWETAMREFIANHREWLQSVISSDWTSCSGFLSFIDNDLETWEKHLFEENDVRYIEVMLTYMAEYELGSEQINSRLYYAVFENICCNEFFVPAKEFV